MIISNCYITSTIRTTVCSEEGEERKRGDLVHKGGKRDDG